MSLNNSTLTTASNSIAPMVYEVKLDPAGGALPVINAEVNQGMGTWVNSFGASAEEGKCSVALELPSNVTLSTEEEYKTTLTWQLTDAPK